MAHEELGQGTKLCPLRRRRWMANLVASHDNKELSQTGNLINTIIRTDRGPERGAADEVSSAA